MDSTDPHSRFGFGTWTSITNQFLYCTDAESGKTGGEAEHKLTIEEMPSHQHKIYSGYSEASAGIDAYRYQNWGKNDLGWHGDFRGTSNVGGLDNGETQAHNNMPPYMTVYAWQRTA